MIKVVSIYSLEILIGHLFAVKTAQMYSWIEHAKGTKAVLLKLKVINVINTTPTTHTFICAYKLRLCYEHYMDWLKCTYLSLL